VGADRSAVRLEELDFDLPREAIAQRPAEPRDSCRLMHLPSGGGYLDARFSDLPLLLQPEDTLVFNNSKVLPARVMARKPSGGTVELLFLHPVAASGEDRGERWEALARPSSRLQAGTEVKLSDGQGLTLAERVGEGRWVVHGPPGRSMLALMETHGRLPLPPYIKTYPADPSVYQTVYASAPGSSAAPTAGLHFTRDLLGRIRSGGVRTAEVTLHVGSDTFLPIRESVVEEHRIHSEAYSVSCKALEAIRLARAAGGRIVGVGTTVARVLETLALNGALFDSSVVGPASGLTDIFITPGHRFAGLDVLLTNFHLPRSTVMALTMAFAGADRLKQAYAQALALGYRFYSFGDAMLIGAPQLSETRDKSTPMKTHA
jgi:S-adenosylmethionine:tRNA ribosyltransferase-isomerase